MALLVRLGFKDTEQRHLAFENSQRNKDGALLQHGSKLGRIFVELCHLAVEFDMRAIL